MGKQSTEIEELQKQLAQANSEKEQMVNRLNEIEVESRKKASKFGLCQKRYLEDIKGLKSKLQEAESKNGELQAEVSRLQDAAKQAEGVNGALENQVEAMSKEILSLRSSNSEMVQDLNMARDCSKSLDEALKKTRAQLSQTKVYMSQDEKKLEYYDKEFKNFENNAKRFLSIKTVLGQVYEIDEEYCNNESKVGDGFDVVNDDEVRDVVESMLQDLVTFKKQHKLDIAKLMDSRGQDA